MFISATRDIPGIIGGYLLLFPGLSASLWSSWIQTQIVLLNPGSHVDQLRVHRVAHCSVDDEVNISAAYFTAMSCWFRGWWSKALMLKAAGPNPDLCTPLEFIFLPLLMSSPRTSSHASCPEESHPYNYYRCCLECAVETVWPASIECRSVWKALENSREMTVTY